MEKRINRSSLSAEDMSKEIGVIGISQSVKCKLTPEGIIAYNQYLQTPLNYYPGTLKGNELTTNLWMLMKLLGPLIEMGGPCLIENNKIHLFREKTYDELIQAFGERINESIKD